MPMGSIREADASWKYLVKSISTTKAKICDHHGLSFKEELHADAIKYALDNLTAGRVHPEVVRCHGDMNLGYPAGNVGIVDIPNLTELRLTGKWKVNNAVNKTIFTNKTDPGGDIRISGWAEIDGNMANQTDGGGIKIVNTSLYGGAGLCFDIEKILIHDTRSHAFELALYGGEVRMNHITQRDTFDRALYCKNVWDSMFYDITLGAWEEQVWFENSGDIKMSQIYVGNKSEGSTTASSVYLKQVQRGKFRDFTVDQPYKHGVLCVQSGAGAESQCYDLEFAGVDVHNQDNMQADDTYSGFRFDNETHRCKVIGGFVGRKNSTIVTHAFKYAVEEVAASGCNYNVAHGLTCRDIDTALANKVGANSDFTHIYGNII